MEDKIDLAGIRREIAKLPGNRGEGEFTDACMREAIDQALVLASKKAKTKQVKKKYENTKGDYHYYVDVVDEQSILDVRDLIV